MYEILYQLGINAGPQAALIAFFVWQSDRREKRLEAKVEGLHTFHNETLVNLVETGDKTITRNTHVLQRLEFTLSADPDPDLGT